MDKLEKLMAEIKILDQGIVEVMVSADYDATEMEIEGEYNVIYDYEDKVAEVTLKMRKLLPRNGSVSPTPSESSVAVSSKRKTYKLPKIEIKKFNGDLKEWLSFWSQFQKIHEDPDLHASDKFQYLVQSIISGTRAKDLVDSYPQTADNYPKVIEALKERYGKEKLLIQVYVRELLKMVINNNTNKSVKVAQMFDRLESHLRALESLGVTTEQTVVFLYPMVESSLPEETLIAWQRSPLNGLDGSKEVPPKSELDYLMQFLRKEVENEDQRMLVQSGFTENASKEKNKLQMKAKRTTNNEDCATAAGLYTGDNTACLFCDKSSHESKDCFKAYSMTLEDKREVCSKKNSCSLFLKKGHGWKDCKTTAVKCIVCAKRHVAVMCWDLPSHKSTRKDKKTDKQTNKNSEKSTEPKNENSAENVNAGYAGSSTVFLGTFRTTIVNGMKSRKVRALYDPGAQRSYIGKKTVEFLGLQAIGEEKLSHFLFGGVQTSIKNHRIYDVKVKSTKGESINSLRVLEKEKICGQVPQLTRGPWMKELKGKGIWISDMDDKDQEIELLIGADVFGQLITGQQYQLKNGLTALETVLGWIVIGKVVNKEQRFTSENVAMTLNSLFVSETTPEQLWDLETIGIRDSSEIMSKEDKEVATKKHFLKTVTRSEDGGYSVSLPWMDGRQKIPDNRRIAEKRLDSATKKIIEKGKYQEYNNIFNAWIDEGIIEQVPLSEMNFPCHYLPHRPVFKPESLTTPIRPVFDASCKIGRNPSLNDCLEKGPNLLDLIPSLVLRFREGRIGVISDIRKAFLMIEVQKEDRDFLRFLWWEDPHQKTHKVYRHNRVVFGVNCSPFLLGAVIEYHLRTVSEDRKETAEKLLKSLYVDNCVTSVDTIKQYEDFRREATEIMLDAKMELRLWQCTAGEVSGIGPLTSRGCGLETGSFGIATADSPWTSVLGLKWNTSDDILRCDLNFSSLDEKITKRKILSCAQKVYDPIGFLCPALLPPKLILQEAWSQKTGWDEDLDEEKSSKFLKWYQELSCLQEIQIPRNFNGGESSHEFWELHTFCDASKDAYAAVIFLKVSKNEKISVQLLQAKSRVAPLKKNTIPRLELLGCVIGARLTDSVKKALGLRNVPTFFWSDSTTALAWIKGNDEWGPFVGNRVKEILKLTNENDWRHVPGVINPADLPSRGCSPSQLLESRWWEGPEWLYDSQNNWPSETPLPNEDDVMAEKRKTAAVNIQVTVSDNPWYATKSSHYENVRILAWIRRFIENCRKSTEDKIVGALKFQEIISAEEALLKVVQKEIFQGESDVISGIRVERDKNGLIHVKTKLLYRQDTPGFRYPILLPHSHPVVDHIIQEQHRLNGHSGIQFLMGTLREKYWILQGRRAIRKIVGKCAVCRRFTSKNSEVVAAPLPEDRVKSAKVFEATGVDLAGPLYLKEKKKVWILILTCAVYRCVHLELVESLSTEAFLEAFSRFTAIRGRPSIVYSDNGTNFVGAVNAFKKINWEAVTRSCGIERIQWRVKPPSAAWWGGWWERLIRSVKDLLKRILGNAKVSYSKLQNILTNVAAYINSRPLTTVTEDPEDLIALTLAMFLSEIPGTSYGELDFLSGSEIRKLYHDRKTVLDEFKVRFRKEYLAQLVQRQKEKKFVEFRIGDVVLVGAENRKRLDWPLAKFVELIRGRDGYVRLVRVKTANGNLLRPVQRLYPLEISSAAEIPQISDEDGKEASTELTPKNDPSTATTLSGRRVKVPKRLRIE